MGVARAEREVREHVWRAASEGSGVATSRGQSKAEGTKRALAGCMRCGGKRVSASSSDTFHCAGHKYKVSVQRYW